KTAAEAKTASEKIAAQAEFKAKTVAEASAAAERAESEAAERAKSAEKSKEEALNRVKEMAEKDVTATFYSSPIQLRVAPAPITIQLGQSKFQLRAGSKLEIPIKLTRLYNFADAVDFNLVVP